MSNVITNREAFKRYNLWRYDKLGREYPCFDIDEVEVRHNEPVAIFEVTMFRFRHAIRPEMEKSVLKRSQFQYEREKKMADKLGAKLYIVGHTEDMTYFVVYDYNEKVFYEFNEQQYIMFLKRLKKEPLIEKKEQIVVDNIATPDTIVAPKPMPNSLDGWM